MTTNALLDALHAELLVDVGELTGSMNTLKEQLPAMLQDVRDAAQGVKDSSRETLEDFQAMGHGLMAAVRDQVAAERQVSVKAAEQSSQVMRESLAQFSKFLWLLSGLAGVNTVILIAVIAVLAAK